MLFEKHSLQKLVETEIIKNSSGSSWQRIDLIHHYQVETPRPLYLVFIAGMHRLSNPKLQFFCDE